jgi:hypothetical protein
MLLPCSELKCVWQGISWVTYIGCIQDGHGDTKGRGKERVWRHSAGRAKRKTAIVITRAMKANTSIHLQGYKVSQLKSSTTVVGEIVNLSGPP